MSTAAIMKESIVSLTNMSLNDCIELTKNPIRSLCEAIIDDIAYESYGTIRTIHINKKLNPMGIVFYYSLARCFMFESDDDDRIYEYPVAHCVMTCGFGHLTFSLDASDLSLLIEGHHLNLEERTSGREVMHLIYDELSKPDSTVMHYDKETVKKCEQYLCVKKK